MGFTVIFKPFLDYEGWTQSETGPAPDTAAQSATTDTHAEPIVVYNRAEQAVDVMRCGFATHNGPGRYCLVFDAESCTEAQPVHVKLSLTSSISVEPVWFGNDTVSADAV